MRNKIATASAVQLHFKAYFKGLLGGCVIFAANGVSAPVARAQSEAEMSERCNSWLDSHASAQGLTTDERHQVIGLCLAGYGVCAFSTMPGFGSEAESRERMNRCMDGVLKEADKHIANTERSAVPTESANSESQIDRCKAAFPAHVDSTIKHCSAAIEQASAAPHDLALAHAYRALAIVAKDNHDRGDKASADANAALQLDGSLGEAYFALAEIHGNRGYIRQCIQDVDHALMLHLPQYMAARAHDLRGMMHTDLAIVGNNAGEFQLAMDDTNEAIRLEPSNPEYYRRRAGIEDYRGQKAAAAADLAQANRLASSQ